METQYYLEMVDRLNQSIVSDELKEKEIFVFGHCEATMRLVDELFERRLRPKAILDNNAEKYGISYQGINVQSPDTVLKEEAEQTIVLIVTRFYEAMNAQLRNIGFGGIVRKLVDYNTYAEYSLSEQTLQRKRKRCMEGAEILKDLEDKYSGAFFVMCPFPALGDVYFCMSYLSYFMAERGITKVVVCVSAKACADVVRLFGRCAEILMQKKLDVLIQAVISLQYGNAFVAHQDRPYTINLHRALHIKRIPLEKIYKTGVFGLTEDVKPEQPTGWREFRNSKQVKEGKTAILSPYAKSVPALPEQIWMGLIEELKASGYDIYTNCAETEKALPDTLPICTELAELKTLVEKAGLFIGIRSGLCDVIRTADCRKIALYPDYYYCDTKWKAIDIYAIDGFENIVVKDESTWEELMLQIKL